MVHRYLLISFLATVLRASPAIGQASAEGKPCAHIRESNDRKEPGGISSIWVVNDLKDHGVMVTVHQHLWVKNAWVDGERVVDVLPGKELFFGSRPVGGEINIYEVAACEVR